MHSNFNAHNLAMVGMHSRSRSNSTCMGLQLAMLLHSSTFLVTSHDAAAAAIAMGPPSAAVVVAARMALQLCTMVGPAPSVRTTPKGISR